MVDANVNGNAFSLQVKMFLLEFKEKNSYTSPNDSLRRIAGRAKPQTL